MIHAPLERLKKGQKQRKCERICGGELWKMTLEKRKYPEQRGLHQACNKCHKVPIRGNKDRHLRAALGKWDGGGGGTQRLNYQDQSAHCSRRYMTDSFNYHHHGLQPQLSTNQGGPALLQWPRGAPCSWWDVKPRGRWCYLISIQLRHLQGATIGWAHVIIGVLQAAPLSRGFWGEI